MFKPVRYETLYLTGPVIPNLAGLQSIMLTVIHCVLFLITVVQLNFSYSKV